MHKIKAVFFDVDDTLYDSTFQAESARRNAIKAMIEAGLNLTEETAMRSLRRIVRRFGSNYLGHFNELLRESGYNGNPRIMAAGLIAYHNTKLTCLVPFRDTVPTLLSLRDRNYKLGIITNGLAVKQWEKLIRLGIQHFFDSVIISEEIGREKPDPRIFKLAIDSLKCKPSEAMMVGDRIDRDIVGAKKIGMLTVQILKGNQRDSIKNSEEEPDYIIPELRDILNILEK